MIQVRNTIKFNFKTGKYPTEQQFWDWIDSFVHCTEDTIEMANVKGLIDAMNKKADQQAFQQLWNLFQQLPENYAAKNHTHAFDSITEKPTTLGGYGISDAYTKLELDNKFAPINHDHTTNEIEDFQTGVEDIINALKNVNNGLAALDVNGKLSNAVLPALSTTEVYPVASESEMLALTAERGDFAVRTDTTPSTVFILTVDNPAILSNWLPVSTAGGILTVNGKSGPSVQLTTSDIPEGTQKYFTATLARSAFSAGYGISFGQSGQINNTLTTLQSITSSGNSNLTSSAIKITGAGNYPTTGTGLILSYDPSRNRSIIYSHDQSTPAWKGLEINASQIVLNNASGGSVYLGYQQPEDAPADAMFAVGGNAAFEGNVSGLAATAPNQFTTFQQLNDFFIQGAWTPLFNPNVQAEITVQYAYYVKTGKSVRLIAVLDIANPTVFNSVEITGLPYTVVNMGANHPYKAFYGISFADSTASPGTAYKELDLRAQSYHIIGGTNNSWDTLKNKTVYFDISYLTD